MFQGQPPKQIQKTTVLLETWLLWPGNWAGLEPGKTLHLVRVYQARVLHGGQVMWCCVRVVQPQVYRACVCIYIHIIYILYICIFNIPTFLALCFSTSVFLRTFTSRCQERSWWNCILGWRHCICSCWMARAKIVGMPRGLRAGLHEEKQRDFQQTCGYDTSILW